MHGLSGIVGQEPLVKRLREFAGLYLERGGVPDHILLVGSEGMGKRTIAVAFSEELGAHLTLASAAMLEKKGDLTAILTSLDPREIFLLEEVNRLRQPLREILLVSLRDFRVDLIIGQGPGARVHPYQLNRFTCISSVHREGDCPREFRETFPLVLRLQEYSKPELVRMTSLISDKNLISIAPAAAGLISAACNGNPHRIEVLIHRIARGEKKEISEADARKYLSVLGITSHHPTSPLSVNSIDMLSGHEFEKLVGALMARMGFHIEMTKASGDGGVDIVATLERAFVGGRYLIQCKRFAIGTPVGAPLVREFYGTVTADQETVKGIFITTSNFTDQARDFARKLPIDLIDREQLLRLLEACGLSPATT